MSEVAHRMRMTYEVTGDRWFKIAAETCDERDVFRSTIADAIEAMERGSTSAPVLEVLKAALSRPMSKDQKCE